LATTSKAAAVMAMRIIYGVVASPGAHSASVQAG
jgi:hypothetical protein